MVAGGGSNFTTLQGFHRHSFNSYTLPCECVVCMGCVTGSTVNASPFVINGEAFFLNSPSDYIRLSLSAERVVKPICVVELQEDDALKMQLEPDTTESQEELAADVKVVVTEEDQAAPSDRFELMVRNQIRDIHVM